MDYHSGLIIYKIALIAITPAISTIFIFALVLLLFFSFLLSGAQVAYFSLGKRDINLLKTRPQQAYQRIVTLLQSPKSLFTSMLIANTIVNILIILISNILLDEWVYQLALPETLIIIIKIVIITIVLVMLAEILPKIWASHHKIWFASTSSTVVEITTLLFGKISNQVVKTDNAITRMIIGKQKLVDRESDRDIDLLSEDDASNEEKDLLKGIRKFGNTTVKQTMRTRLDVVGIEYNSGYAEVLQRAGEMIYSRIPVYKGNLDEIAGILHTKDLLPHLHEADAFEWQNLLRPVYYVHEQKPIEDLLQEFRNRRNHMAVVVDEFGGTSGIITLEDVIEEIVGDIQDEFDEEENQNYKIDSRNFLFEGKIMIDDACRIMKLPANTFDEVRGDSDSIAGLVLEIAGEFPEANSELVSNGFTFKPLEINKNRILKVQVTLPNELTDEK